VTISEFAAKEWNHIIVLKIITAYTFSGEGIKGYIARLGLIGRLVKVFVRIYTTTIIKPVCTLQFR
jgi:hypothetical protein